MIDRSIREREIAFKKRWHQQLNSQIDVDKFKYEMPNIDAGEEKCSHFGCGKSLTLEEKLFGDKCFEHKQENKLTHQINNYISGMITPTTRCEKRCYPNRHDAKKFIKEFNKEGRGDKKLTNSYWCQACQAYHVTSTEKKKSRSYTRKSNRKKLKNKK